MWMLAIVIVISSSIFFYKMKIFRPYYNEYVASVSYIYIYIYIAMDNLKWIIYVD